MSLSLPVSTQARAVGQEESSEKIAQTDTTSGTGKARELVTAATLLCEMKDDFARLSADVQRLNSTFSDSVHEATQLTLTYTRLYHSAVEVLQEATEEAVDTAKQLAQRCISLGKELRGTDLLAERVHRLRRSVDQLEGQINRLL